jgi:hypothetical protein
MFKVVLITLRVTESVTLEAKLLGSDVTGIEVLVPSGQKLVKTFIPHSSILYMSMH